MAANGGYGSNMPREGEWTIRVLGVERNLCGIPCYLMETEEPVDEIYPATGRQGWRAIIPSSKIRYTDCVTGLNPGECYSISVKRYRKENCEDYEILVKGVEDCV